MTVFRITSFQYSRENHGLASVRGNENRATIRVGDKIWDRLGEESLANRTAGLTAITVLQSEDLKHGNVLASVRRKYLTNMKQSKG